MRNAFITLLVCLLLPGVHPASLSRAAPGATMKAGEGIVPKPLSVQPGHGTFTLSARTRIVYPHSDSGLRATAQYLARFLRASTGYAFTADSSTPIPRKDFIAFSPIRKSDLGPQAYRLTVKPAGILIEAGDGAGAFYAAQTVLQLLPPEIFSRTPVKKIKWEIPALSITDGPRYGWRGMMLDVSRHFFPKEFVKEFIDELAIHKMNVFHWHLTDDQGWRIEIKRYPQLTSIGAWRVDRETVPWSARTPARPGEVATYGGYYTQEDIREIVRYAAERFITIVPEIEMPAHATAVITAFPELSCTGGPFTVPTGGLWPIKDIYCGGNDSVFTFLENVLSEVTGLFPGTYVHIGGDEADKTEWKRCSKCQSRIKADSLGDEAGLQSYFVKRIEKFLESKGKRLIGWDEILEGGIAPEATVMSWRGTRGGIEAAKSGHDVVMTPTSHCYFDYYQGDWRQEPIAWGGYLPLTKVYAFEPTPEDLTPEEAHHVLGAQGNIWSETVTDPWKAQYMAFPRITAMSEVTWSAKEQRNWTSFTGRLEKQLARYAARGIAVAPSAYTVTMKDSFDRNTWARIVTLNAEIGQGNIRYTLDGKEPGKTSPVYVKPLVIKKGGTLKAAVVLGNRKPGPTMMRQIFISPRGLQEPVLASPLDLLRNGSGPSALIDNIRASEGARDTRWQGMKEKDLDAVIDLGGMRKVRRITAGFYQNGVDLIFLPAGVEYSVSDDGVNFRSVGTLTNDYPTNAERPVIRDFSSSFSAVGARYVKVHARSVGKCPDWHRRAGEPAWMYVDEIFVE
jgi:hexosaminidase